MENKKREYKLLKPGPGRFYIKWASNKKYGTEETLMSSTGFKMIKICCVTTDSIGDEEDIMVNFTVSGIMFLQRLIGCVGIPKNYNPVIVMDDPDLLEGRDGSCVISHETYNGNTRNKISTFVRKLENQEFIDHKQELKKAVESDFDFDDSIPF